MGGYRESSFDPAGGNYGPPLRPYNWVQWTGVAFALAGVAINLAYLAGQAGLARKILDGPGIGIALPLLGIALVNSRREPGQPSDALKRRRALAITLAIVALLLGVAVAIFVSKGA